MANPPRQQQAMTFRAKGLANRIIIPVDVSKDGGAAKEYPGLIDTGATHTCISEELAAEMGLVSVGQTETGTAGGKTKANKYVANLSLNGGRIRIPRHKLVSAKLAEQPGVEMLIGMDILMHGDFAITNRGGITVASLRMPSSTMIDFVPEANQFNKFEIAKAKRSAGKSTKKNRRRKGGNQKGLRGKRKRGR